MGKLQFIQDTVTQLDDLYVRANDQVVTTEKEPVSMSASAKKGKEKSKGNDDSSSTSEGPPPVFPMTQSEVREDGTVVNKRVKPLTYSLMSWLKNYMGLPDSIDISDDENHAQLEISLDHDYEFKCYFNTDETSGIIGFYIYHFDDLVPEEKVAEIKELILSKNIEHVTGQVQLISSSSTAQAVRYYHGVCVKGIASEDPNYSGEFQISPQLYQNMFEQGLETMNAFVPELQEALE
jgi:hypothetical protein